MRPFAFTSLFVGLALLAGPTAAANPVVDFEEFVIPNPVTDGLVLPSLTAEFLDVDGSGLDVTIVGNAQLRVFDLDVFSGGYPGATGKALVDNSPGGNNPLGADIFFSEPVIEVSVDMGDLGGDADTPMVLTAYDAANQVVDTASAPWPAGALPPFETVTVAGADIVRVHWTSGSGAGGRSSILVDNIEFVPTQTTSVEETSWSQTKEQWR